RYWARMARSSTTPVSCSMRSARVDLPWSMWAMMQKLRSSSGAVAAGAIADVSSELGIGDTHVPWTGMTHGQLPRADTRPPWSHERPVGKNWNVRGAGRQVRPTALARNFHGAVAGEGVRVGAGS